MSRRLVTLIATSVGVALLVLQIRSSGGVSEILDVLQRLGPSGLALILGASLLRQVFRTLAWILLMDARVPFSTALAATMSGDAIGNLTPLSLLASEPAKAMFVRAHIPAPRALAALADSRAWECDPLVVSEIDLALHEASAPLERQSSAPV